MCAMQYSATKPPLLQISATRPTHHTPELLRNFLLNSSHFEQIQFVEVISLVVHPVGGLILNSWWGYYDRDLEDGLSRCYQ